MTHRPQGGAPVLEADYRPRGFWALVVTQFQGAFNDNVYQWLIVFSLIADLEGRRWRRPCSSFASGHTSTVAPYDYVTGLSGILFSLPFILFSFPVSSARWRTGDRARGNWPS